MSRKRKPINKTAYIVAVIGIIGTISSAIISPYVSYMLNDIQITNQILNDPLAQKRSLKGVWVGMADQKKGLPQFLNKHKVIINFIEPVKGEAGTLSMELNESLKGIGNTLKAKGKLRNRFYDGVRLFKVDYSSDEGAIHFGSIYGEVSPDGKKIVGKFLGYGQFTNGFVSGEIILNKRG